MNINEQKLIFTNDASIKIFRSQVIPGKLILLKDRIYFKARGFLKGTEIKDTFSFEEIKNMKFGLLILSFRILITLNGRENWVTDKINSKDAKKFVELYKIISSNYC